MTLVNFDPVEHSLQELQEFCERMETMEEMDPSNHIAKGGKCTKGQDPTLWQAMVNTQPIRVQSPLRRQNLTIKTMLLVNGVNTIRPTVIQQESARLYSTKPNA